jgi:hypothetical protein
MTTHLYTVTDECIHYTDLPVLRLEEGRFDAAVFLVPARADQCNGEFTFDLASIAGAQIMLHTHSI